MDAANTLLTSASSFATEGALSVWSVMGDFTAVLIVAGALFIFAWYMGRGPFIALLLSFYCSYAVYNVFPFIDYLPSAPAFTAFIARVALYGAVSIIFYLILRRVAVSDFLFISIFGLIPLSLLGGAFLLAVAYHSFAITEAYQLTPAITSLFSGDLFFWWFISPAVGLFFLAR